MQRVYRDPSQRSFAGFRVVIDDHPLPVVGGQSGKDIAEQLCRVGQLAGYILGLLVGIPIVDSPLIASRRRTVGSIHPAGREYPFALHEQHVPQMAAILQGRPDARLPPRSQVSLSVAQDGHDVGDALPDIPLDRLRRAEVVNETAVWTLIHHLAIVMPQCGVVRGLPKQPQRSYRPENDCCLGLALVAQKAELHGGTASRLLLRLPGPRLDGDPTSALAKSYATNWHARTLEDRNSGGGGRRSDEIRCCTVECEYGGISLDIGDIDFCRIPPRLVAAIVAASPSTLTSSKSEPTRTVPLGVDEVKR
jgi:hypothetical protein